MQRAKRVCWKVGLGSVSAAGDSCGSAAGEDDFEICSRRQRFSGGKGLRMITEGEER